MPAHDVLTLPGHEASRLATARFVVLPLGSIEYHGPHAPLGVDTTLAQGLAASLARRADGIALPPLAYTLAPTITAARPGTVSIASAPFLAYLEALLEALARAGTRRLLALNAHSENQFALRLAAESVAGRHPDLSVAIANWWRFVPSGTGSFSEADGHGHGGPLEIAATAAFDARGVDPTLARDIAYEAPWWRGGAQVVGAGQAPEGFDGYHGRVSEIDAEAGRAIVDAALDELERFVEDWLARAGRTV
jgi:creatinine amidohydrolase